MFMKYRLNGAVCTKLIVTFAIVAFHTDWAIDTKKNL